jgi:hypothetical protein
MEEQTLISRYQEENLQERSQTCTDETKPERTMTQRILETEMKIFRKITNKTLRDRVGREDTRNTCKVDYLNEWVRGRKKNGTTV